VAQHGRYSQRALHFLRAERIAKQILDAAVGRGEHSRRPAAWETNSTTVGKRKARLGYPIGLAFRKLFERAYVPLTAGVMAPFRGDCALAGDNCCQLADPLKAQAEVPVFSSAPMCRRRHCGLYGRICENLEAPAGSSGKSASPGSSASRLPPETVTARREPRLGPDNGD
jgi:hypothetical protein